MSNEFEVATISRLEELKTMMLRKSSKTFILNEFKKDLLHLLSTQDHWTFSELSIVISTLIRSRY